MNISYRWLQDLVTDLTAPPREVADRLAMLGAPVDDVIEIGEPLRDVVIARVLEFRRHPNADRLNLCTVDAGLGYTLQVVCGAPNVKADTLYPFAPVGASLPGGVSIRKAKIRGEESQGMLCSAREMNLGRDHDGILELHGTLTPGTSFIESVGLDDTRLVVDITPNRADLLSHAGIAREIAAAYGLRSALHPLPDASALDVQAGRAREAGVQVSIEDETLCPKYLGLVIRGVRVGPSPEWLASRLRAIGLRPISNVVDATNYVLHELGQPLHAFDLAKLGDTIVVRRAQAGERISTLDGAERPLAAGMLVIADAQRPVAIAGVMGGADTEVHDGTQDILLEGALFDAKSVRSTRRALSLSTDASYRFERGVDPDGLLRALQRAAELIIAAAGGTAEPRAAAAGSGMPATPEIALRTRRIEQVLGVAISAQQAADYLAPLGFRISSRDDTTLRVAVPGHRRYDVSREDDLIEEIARRHGYDAFPDELRPYRPGTVPTHPLFLLEDRVRELLVGRGLLEAHTAAFAPESDGVVRLMLPLAATEARLRADLLPGLLRRVEANFARGARSIRLFEIGTVFGAAEQGTVPVEQTRLAIAFTGMRRPPHWSEPSVACDVWDLKGLADEIGTLLGLDAESGPGNRLLDDALSFTLRERDNGRVFGAAGRVAPARVDAPAWADDVWGLEVELRAPDAPPGLRYRELPQQPAVERDLALLVPHALSSDVVRAAIVAGAGPLLEATDAFDVYTGAGLPDGVRSIAYRLRFRAPDRTLTDAEVDEAVRRVLKRLADEHGIQQRA